MQEIKYIPKRRCISCRKTFPQYDLIRIIQNEDGLHVQSVAGRGGRSCYICKDPACISKALEKNLFSKILRRNVSGEETEVLREEINNIY